MEALNLELNVRRYIDLLDRLIGETKSLQNNPKEYIPQEDKAIKHLLEALKPHSTDNNGPLTLEHIAYVEGRGNLIIGYTPPGANEGTIAFIGSHLDVVPADENTWERYPFKLTVDGDKLYGRGTTDCLGHVALLTDMFIQLAEKKPALKREIWAVFIASEESSVIPDVGVDALLKNKKLDRFINGPVYWVDSADSHPCIGTASAAMWTLIAQGHQCHSSLPNKAINSIELAQEAVLYLQNRFYEDFPPHPKEEEYKFETPSTMKPTQIQCATGPTFEIPAWAEVKGDIRLTPFYNITECVAKIEAYIDELNQDPSLLKSRGPCSSYELVDEETGNKLKASFTFKLNGEALKGIACSTESDGFKHLDAATREVLGESIPYSDTGSLPLVGDMQEAGFDIQVTGYGHTHVYHGDNEYCSLSAMQDAMKIFSIIMDRYNK